MRIRSTALAISVLLLLGGCAVEAAPESRSVVADAGTGKTGTGELSHDLQPLVDRFPGLADAASASWSSGTIGSDDRATGPTTYWIDAVVVLPVDAYDALRSAHEFREAEEAPRVVDALEASVPGGVLLVADGLDAQFAQPEGASRAYLSDATRSIVLLSLFE